MVFRSPYPSFASIFSLTSKPVTLMSRIPVKLRCAYAYLNIRLPSILPTAFPAEVNRSTFFDECRDEQTVVAAHLLPFAPVSSGIFLYIIITIQPESLTAIFAVKK